MRAVLVRTALASLLCLAAGCGADSPAPKPYGGASTSVSASASPSGAPTTPEILRSENSSSAAAFVSFYFATFAYASNSGDVTALRDLGSSSCESCNGIVDTIRSAYRAGGGNSGAKYVVTNGSAVKKPDVWLVTATVSGSPQKLRATSSAKVEVVPAFKDRVEFQLKKSGNGWTVQDWTRL